MQNQNTLTIMLHSQNFDIKIEDSFTIFLSVSLYNDFKDKNITRQQMLHAYILKNYALYLQEQKVNKIIESIEAQEAPLQLNGSESAII